MTSGNGVKIVKSGCFFCHAGCAIDVHVKDGRVIKVEGSKDHPHNRGKICVKSLRGPDLLYSPKRLLYPLKRDGARGEGKWKRISWDEAIDTCATELQKVIDKYGPLAITGGDGTKGDDAAWIVDLFLLNLGTPNRTGPGRAQCMMPRRESSKATFGNYYTADFEGKTKCVLMWGDQAEISNHNSVLGWKVQGHIRNGAKLLVVDPRRTAYARRADTWLQIRPSADLALAMSMIHVIMEEEWFDRPFVEKWTNSPFLVDMASNRLLRDGEGRYLVWDAASGGPAPVGGPGVQPTLDGEFEVGGASCKTVWRILKERCAKFPPAEAAALCWLKAEDIVETARVYSHTKPAVLTWGVPLDMNTNAHQTPRALCILQAITGNVDNEGGNYYPVPRARGHRDFVENFARSFPAEVYEKQIGADRFKLCAGPNTRLYANNPGILKAILTGEPYPVRAWVAIGGNPMMTWANTKEVFRALMKLDFHMGLDHFMTASMQLADIVLPAPTHFEKERLAGPHGYSPFGNVVCVRAIEPLGEVRDDFEVCGDILRRMGKGQHWPWKTVVEFYDERLRESGLTWEEVVAGQGLLDQLIYDKHETDYFRKGGGFPTETGKVEIWCTRWQDNGYDPLPSFIEPPESPYSTPELAQEYPFVVITGGRMTNFFNSQHRQVPSLRKMHPQPITQIHPEAAAKLGIENGDWICVESPRGKCVQRARLFDGIDPRVINVQHAWWYPDEEPSLPNLYGVFRSNANTLTPNKDPFLDQAFGGYTLRGFLGRVTKITEAKAMAIGIEDQPEEPL